MQSIVVGLGVAKPESDQPVHTSGVSPIVSPLRILLAEDSYPNQVLATGLLRKRGHIISVANHGEEAIEMLQEQGFDLVLMDVQMPVMDGLEATRSIRRMEAREKLHSLNRKPLLIVAMTAHAMKGDRELCLESGMNDYLSKPIRTHELDEILAKSFSADQAPETAADSTNVIDWSEALSIVDGDTELLKVVAAAFLEEAGSLQSQLATALSSGDAKAIQQLGHTLKGAVGAFGAHNCRSLAEQLESFGRLGESAMAQTCFGELQVELRRVCDLLKLFIAGVLHPHH